MILKYDSKITLSEKHRHRKNNKIPNPEESMPAK